MQTANTTPRSVSHTPKRPQTPAKPLNERDMGDAYFISLIEEAVKSERVSFEEVMKVLE